ncbi:LuxR C-terminal-related transcriptional regulator [Citrobacter amalonaticus]|uniref:LuxR C-terminal-related transcriptional regulator n=1 Tax=Citrobacter amalonaticus TaxID=35703 RepID=UPI001A1EE039|nr:helix-turn-helix transcriptional regulator [Citrobacter amalonaticus]HDQ2813309.1 helix-turn-helix transcriptional regulator [Citrobacter amalonaticus]
MLGMKFLRCLQTVDELQCCSCDKKCSFIDYPSSLENCPIPPFYIWPDSNPLLKEGFICFLNQTKFKHSAQRTVFINFSTFFLHNFLNDNWFKEFSNSRIILVCDRKLAPLANYFFYSEPSFSTISSVIYPHDDNDTIAEKIFNTLNGRIYPPSRKMERLSINEFRILQKYYKGMNTKKIASIYNYNVKTVYTYKARIEKKLQLRLRDTI